MVPLGEMLLDQALEGALERAAAADDISERVLDAAREQFRISGIRRSSVEDVARRAGVSRITVYRRFATKDELVKQLLLRELAAYFVQFRAGIARADTAAERVVEGFVVSLRAARSDPLVGGLMTVEPQALVPFLTTEGGRVLAAVSVFLATQLRREQEAGHIPASVDVRIVAELLARVTLSFFLTPQSCLDLDDTTQLRDFARRFLAPLIEAR